MDFAKHNHLFSYEAVPINFKVGNDGTIDFKMTAATSGFSLGIRRFLRQVTREIQFMKRFRPDVVFSDSRASSLVAAKLMRIPVVLMLNQYRVEIVRRPTARKLSLLDRLFFFIANIGWLFIRTSIQLVWSQSRIILVPDLPSPYTICEGNLAIPKRYTNKVRLIGPIVDNHGPGNGNRHRIDPPERGSAGKPMVYAAISGPKVERRILSRMLIHSLRGVSRKYRVVISCGEPNSKQKPRSANGLRIYDWIEDQDDVIRASDVVVCRAGHGTIMKSLAFGKPMILIPIPDHTEQYGNARRAQSLHVAEVMEQISLNPATLGSTIEQVIGNEEYRRSAIGIQREVASMHAVSVACDEISRVADHR